MQTIAEDADPERRMRRWRNLNATKWKDLNAGEKEEFKILEREFKEREQRPAVKGASKKEITYENVRLRGWGLKDKLKSVFLKSDQELQAERDLAYQKQQYRIAEKFAKAKSEHEWRKELTRKEIRKPKMGFLEGLVEKPSRRRKDGRRYVEERAVPAPAFMDNSGFDMSHLFNPSLGGGGRGRRGKHGLPRYPFGKPFWAD